MDIAVRTQMYGMGDTDGFPPKAVAEAEEFPKGLNIWTMSGGKSDANSQAYTGLTGDDPTVFPHVPHFPRIPQVPQIPPAWI